MTSAPLLTGTLGQSRFPKCSEPGKMWCNETKEGLEVTATAPHKMWTDPPSAGRSEAGLGVHGPPAEHHRCSAHTDLASQRWDWSKRQQQTSPGARLPAEASLRTCSSQSPSTAPCIWTIAWDGQGAEDTTKENHQLQEGVHLSINYSYFLKPVSNKWAVYAFHWKRMNYLEMARSHFFFH